jgi:hypothetical protein
LARHGKSAFTKIAENLLHCELTAQERAEEIDEYDTLLESLGLRTPAHRPNKGVDSTPLQTTKELAREMGMAERTPPLERRPTRHDRPRH